MRQFIDWKGQRFGHLEVIGRGENYVSPEGVVKTRVRCRCDCGNEVSVIKDNLRSGRSTSCGCSRRKKKGNER